MSQVGTSALLVEYEDGSIGTISLGATIAGSKMNRTVIIKRPCTVFGVVFWPNGSEEGRIGTTSGLVTMKPGDTYTITEMEIT